MEITYFFRAKNEAYSIEKVFKPIVALIAEKEIVKKKFVPHGNASITAIINNIIYIYINRNKKGINHITGYIHYGVIGLVGCKSVLTMHDVVFIKIMRLKLRVPHEVISSSGITASQTVIT